MTKLRILCKLAICFILLVNVKPAAQVAGQVTRVGAAPTVVAAVAPTYPGIALAMPKGGDVIVEVSIRAGGRVDAAKVLRGAGPLLHPAIEAARLWRFAEKDAGKQVSLTFSFKVMPKGTKAEELTPIFKPPYRFEVRRTLPEHVVNYGAGSELQH